MTTVEHAPHEIAPGTTCPACDRRVPFPRTASSPVTKTTSYRIPVDDVDTHDELVEAAARHLGIHDRPHWRYWVVVYAMALVLQGPPKELA